MGGDPGIVEKFAPIDQQIVVTYGLYIVVFYVNKPII